MNEDGILSLQGRTIMILSRQGLERTALGEPQTDDKS
jgi:hypothetical protein